MNEEEKRVEEAPTVQGDESAEAVEAPAKKRAKNLKAKIIGIIVAVVAVAGFGFYQWHETPEFCVAICHTPMDKAYLDTLYANPYVSMMNSVIFTIVR